MRKADRGASDVSACVRGVRHQPGAPEAQARVSQGRCLINACLIQRTNTRNIFMNSSFKMCDSHAKSVFTVYADTDEGRKIWLLLQMACRRSLLPQASFSSRAALSPVFQQKRKSSRIALPLKGTVHKYIFTYYKLVFLKKNCTI